MYIKVKIPAVNDGDVQYVTGAVTDGDRITDVTVSIYPPRKPLTFTIEKLRVDLPKYEFCHCT